MQETNQETVVTPVNVAFAQDVINGLNAIPKRIPSKYFYDAVGDELFQQIMELDEYYLTRTEFSILENYKQQILELINNSRGFHLYELGAGDGYKTKILLSHFLEQKVDFEYSPIDISSNVLEQLEQSLIEELPDLDVRPLVGDYFTMLNSIENEDHHTKVVMFLGSNIGNFNSELALKFLKQLRASITPGDYFLLGVDLKKDPTKILNAYNDSKGVTRAFNLNLLTRINNEFDGDFDISKFQHYPYYDPATGECRSYLISRERQTVHLKRLDVTVEFRAWEAIHMEISKKYHLEELEELASASGFKVVKHLTDENQYFVDSLWQAV